jgi:hypothetical protein
MSFIAKLGSKLGASFVKKAPTVTTVVKKQPSSAVLTKLTPLKTMGAAEKVAKTAPKVSLATAAKGLAAGGVVAGVAAVSGMFDGACEGAMGGDATACKWLAAPREALGNVSIFGNLGSALNEGILITGGIVCTVGSVYLTSVIQGSNAGRYFLVAPLVVGAVVGSVSVYVINSELSQP